MRTSSPRRRGTLVGAALAGALALAITAVGPAAADTDDDDVVVKVKAHTTRTPLLGWTIGLDPGHNGGNASHVLEINEQVPDGRGGWKQCNTTGTTALSGYAEHEFNFDVAVRTRAALEDLGATVVMTRESDDGVGPCVDVRGRFAEDNDVDLMLSIHADGSADPAIAGFFAIVADPPLSESQGQPSLELAQTMITALSDGGFTPSTIYEEALSQRADLATLNFARRPAVMLELGEMRNPAESDLMSSEAGRQAYADALVDGVLDWAGPHDPQ
ncbi:N-acetylmuramoyl-L-alanine amidase [Occultella glacieicola]|uniref:N-acetylmuramoyl-L-alanine amidase n=1 Tax=Occultella glacieicola TaxID=2518684 RepID=A0ABY2E0K8_9MICO|nr:N-acetylmuramoyl-L-alanine amidase [Occultella glacieicola]TDE90055.1 N-acetylmuramoyl-L-alanine amidase [Occultella glacieicola]